MDTLSCAVQALPGSNVRGLRSGRCKANVHWTFCNVSRSSEKCAEAFIYKGFGIFLFKANSLICCLHKIMREH